MAATPSDSRAGEAAAGRLAPFLLSLAAGFALALTPALVWRLRTGSWVCLNESYSVFYLRFAADAYRSHPWYIADPAAPDGATFYPWLQFVPAVLTARMLGLRIFSITLIWSVLAAAGLSASLYLLFRRYLGRPWAAAGCTVLCLADYGFCASRPFVSQVRMVASALLHPRAFVDIPWELLLQWRIPNPSLDLPFLLLHAAAVGRARKRPTASNMWLSGLTFGLLFYVYFYAWTLAVAALCIAFVFDRAARKLYGVTLAVGVALGLPQVMHSFYIKHLTSAEAMNRFGLFAPAPRLSYVTIPWPSVMIIILAGLWIWKSRSSDLIYLWSMVTGGILLSRSRVATGLYLHAYHWDWLWEPFRVILVLLIGFAILRPLIFRWRLATLLGSAFVSLFFLSGVYLSAISVTRTRGGSDRLENYERYQAQRLAVGAKPLAPDSTIAGSGEFCDLAAVAESQRPLGGVSIPRSLVIDNEEWEARVALNAYLRGVTRAQFGRVAEQEGIWFFWENAQLRSAAYAGFMRQYDEIRRDPPRAIARFKVRYVALPADRGAPAYLAVGWTMFQAGPYWQIWERSGS